jgi:hypothetical protein
MNRVEQMKKIQSEALQLFSKKNADYGDAFAKYGIIGVLHRPKRKMRQNAVITCIFYSYVSGNWLDVFL